MVRGQSRNSGSPRAQSKKSKSDSRQRAYTGLEHPIFICCEYTAEDTWNLHLEASVMRGRTACLEDFTMEMFK